MRKRRTRPPKPRRASSNSRAIASSTRRCARRRSGVVTSVQVRGRPGRRRRPADRFDRQGRRAGNRRQRARGPAVAYSRRRRYKAWLASAPDQTFDVVLRELSPQAAAQTRTFRARLKPSMPRPLPLGATATLVVERPVGETASAGDPCRRDHPEQGQAGGLGGSSRRRRAGRNGRAGRRRGARLSQRRSARLRAAGRRARRDRRRAEDGAGLEGRASRSRARRRNQAGRAMKSFNLTEWALEPSRHRAVPDPRDHDRRRAGLHEARPARGSEVLRAVDDGDGDVARRHRPADAGRGAQPDGEEVRAARSLRQGRDVCAPGLRRHDDHRSRAAPRTRISAKRGTRRARSSPTSSSSCPKASSVRSSTTNTATSPACSMPSRATASASGSFPTSPRTSSAACSRCRW